MSDYDYTPTTELIEQAYLTFMTKNFASSNDQAQPEFNRWLKSMQKDWHEMGFQDGYATGSEIVE